MKSVRKTATEDLWVRFEYEDFVTASSWSVPGGLTSSRGGFTAKCTELLIDGGTLDSTYQVTNTATLEDYSVVERSVLIRIVTK